MLYNRNDGQFARVPLETARDNRLSPRAREVLLYMLSCSKDWKFYTTGIATALHRSSATVRSALSELQNLGYVSGYTNHYKNKGKFCRSEINVYGSLYLNRDAEIPDWYGECLCEPYIGTPSNESEIDAMRKELNAYRVYKEMYEKTAVELRKLKEQFHVDSETAFTSVKINCNKQDNNSCKSNCTESQSHTDDSECSDDDSNNDNDDSNDNSNNDEQDVEIVESVETDVENNSNDISVHNDSDSTVDNFSVYADKSNYDIVTAYTKNLNTESCLQSQIISKIDNIDSDYQIIDECGKVEIVEKLKNIPAKLQEIADMVQYVFTTNEKFVRINRVPTGIQKVRDKFSQLTMEHLEYVYSCVSKYNFKSKKGYILTALFNAIGKYIPSESQNINSCSYSEYGNYHKNSKIKEKPMDDATRMYIQLFPTG